MANGQENQSVLWEISGKGLAKKSYLFGTFHNSSTEILTRFQKLKGLIENAETGVFETNGKPIGYENMAEGKLKDIPQPPLDSIFTPSEYELIDDFFSRSPLGSIRPHNNDASLYGMLQVAITYKSNNGNQYVILDHHINHLMDSLGKDVFALDDIHDVSKLSFQAQYRLITELLVTIIKSSDDAIAKNYISSDYIKYLTANLHLKDRANEVIGAVTVERNRIWLPKIVEKIGTRSCFITVGLEHLKYETGLIRLLQNRGYKLTPVNMIDK